MPSKIQIAQNFYGHIKVFHCIVEVTMSFIDFIDHQIFVAYMIDYVFLNRVTLQLKVD